MVSIDKLLLFWLLNKFLEGNIGQLKSDIQFFCVQVWVLGMIEYNDMLQLDKWLVEMLVNLMLEQCLLVDILFDGKVWLNIDVCMLFVLKMLLVIGVEIEESDFFYSFLMCEYVNLCNSNVFLVEMLVILKNKFSLIFEYGFYSCDSVVYLLCYGDQIEECVMLLIGCVEQVLGFLLLENLVNLLCKYFLVLIGYVQCGLILQFYFFSLILDCCKDEYDNVMLLCWKINELLYIQCLVMEVVWLCLFLKECCYYCQCIDVSFGCGVILIVYGVIIVISQV